MQLRQILLVVLVTILFASFATSASIDSCFCQEIVDSNLNLPETAEGDDEPSVVLTNIQSKYLRAPHVIFDVMLTHLLTKHKLRLVSYPILPQAPPAKY